MSWSGDELLTRMGGRAEHRPSASPAGPPARSGSPGSPGPLPGAWAPLHVCHVSLLLMQLHSQRRLFLAGRACIAQEFNVLTASLGSF